MLITVWVHTHIRSQSIKLFYYHSVIPSCYTLLSYYFPVLRHLLMSHIAIVLLYYRCSIIGLIWQAILWFFFSWRIMYLNSSYFFLKGSEEIRDFSGSQVRNHFWWGSKDYVWYQVSNLGKLYARQTLYSHSILPTDPSFVYL